MISLLIAVITAGAIALFASSSPDGLERVAIDRGFIEKGEARQVVSSPMPDYTLPHIENEKFSASLAGILGTLVVFGLGYGLGLLLKRRGKNGTFLHR